MLEGKFAAALWLLVAGLFVAYALYVRDLVRGAIRRAELRGARQMRADATALVKLYSDVAPANYKTLYNHIASGISELPLD